MSWECHKNLITIKWRKTHALGFFTILLIIFLSLLHHLIKLEEVNLMSCGWRIDRESLGRLLVLETEECKVEYREDKKEVTLMTSLDLFSLSYSLSSSI